MSSIYENDINAPSALACLAARLGVRLADTLYAANDFDMMLVPCPMVSWLLGCSCVALLACLVA